MTAILVIRCSEHPTYKGAKPVLAMARNRVQKCQPCEEVRRLWLLRNSKQPVSRDPRRHLPAIIGALGGDF